MHNETVLIVEDTSVGKVYSDYLRCQGFRSDWVQTATEMYEYLSHYKIDVLILDVQLPDGDGVDLVRDLRVSHPQLPIVLISAIRVEAQDRVGGLKNGADDYMLKPIDLKELEAKIEAILRRSTGDIHPNTEPHKNTYSFDGHRFDARLGSLLFADKRQAELTMAERSLMVAFLTNPNKVLQRNNLVKIVLGEKMLDKDRRTIDVRVSRLRKKLEPDGKNNYIRTVRGQGYLFTPEGHEYTGSDNFTDNNDDEK